MLINKLSSKTDPVVTVYDDSHNIYHENIVSVGDYNYVTCTTSCKSGYIRFTFDPSITFYIGVIAHNPILKIVIRTMQYGRDDAGNSAITINFTTVANTPADGGAPDGDHTSNNNSTAAATDVVPDVVTLTPIYE